jgi:hypothetical protein
VVQCSNGSRSRRRWLVGEAALKVWIGVRNGRRAGDGEGGETHRASDGTRRVDPTELAIR